MAATAYETSVMPHNICRTIIALITIVIIPLPITVAATYVGVSLAKGGDGDRVKIFSPLSLRTPAIDDVNDYTDSDSEEDYTGHPFYLASDENETQQSRNIRYLPTH
ncbi:unnamed protein product [Ceratitis capitata]|uniref:(Mediterranean fruit fly) hypothetical protein n=1 Tax=Ceratitis capitata TaxID=7213 RepID=A0A811UQZ2_CERCA|nr:unnamed protein product [Ceratitis capitata]